MNVRTLVVAVALAGAVVTLTPDVAHAGGAIGWADAVNEFSLEGVAAGGALLLIGIVAAGIVLSFGIPGVMPMVMTLCLGGALMANAVGVAGLFGAGGGGGTLDHYRAAVVAPVSH